jgi:Asp/Glu/hydantoin racemase
MDVGLSVAEPEDDRKLLERLIECCRELSGEQIGAVVLGCTGMGHIIDELTALLHHHKIDMQVVEPLRTGVTTMPEYMLNLGHNNLIHNANVGDFPQ